MSDDNSPNRLLKPDERFRKPEMIPEGEVNPFSEAANPNPEVEAEVVSAVSYRPQYVAILPHRASMNIWLAAAALALNLGYLLYFTDFWAIHWVFPPLSFVMALAASWNSAGDLDAIENGAMDRDGIRGTRLALWIGWGAFIVSISLMLLMLGLAMGWIRF